MKKTRVGLLLFYLELYDKTVPENRKKLNKFVKTIENELNARELEVQTSPICRTANEFSSAVNEFERNSVNAIITLHLAYSPSLESADILAETDLPLIILDTTPSYGFGPKQSAAEILYNHGIHGVQDMCNLLLRKGKKFYLETGHWANSDVMDRVVTHVKAAGLANYMRNSRIGRIGNAFKGMGDFGLTIQKLRSTIGIDTIQYDFSETKTRIGQISETDIKEEMQSNFSKFTVRDLPENLHKISCVSNLVVRKWIEENDLTGFTFNFMDIDKVSGFPNVPFLEASRSMARGIGYAGEGDILTSALTGTLLLQYPDTTFTEMFCPDWENNRIFLSHMGEMNLNLAVDKPMLIEKPFPYTDAENTIAAYGRLRPGKAVLVNLAPGPGNTFSFILSSILLDEGNNENESMQKCIRGWFKSAIPVADFLKKYSLAGGTHHCVIVYGSVENEISLFGEMMGWKVVQI